MTVFNPGLTTLTIGHELLIELALLDAGTVAPGEASVALVDAGLVSGGAVDGVAGAMSRVAVAPFRAAVIERFDGSAMKPLFVAWVADGRATLSEPNDDGLVVVTGTSLNLVPALVRQWTNLQVRREPEGRTPIRTTSTVLDTAVRNGEIVPTGDADLDDLMDNWRLAWRASGSYGDSDIDIHVTIVDAGERGVWRVEQPGRMADEEVEVTLVPITIKEATALLGDVVTGRRSRQPAVGETV